MSSTLDQHTREALQEAQRALTILREIGQEFDPPTDEDDGAHAPEWREISRILGEGEASVGAVRALVGHAYFAMKGAAWARPWGALGDGRRDRALSVLGGWFARQRGRKAWR